MRRKLKKAGWRIVSALAGPRRSHLDGRPQSFLVIRRNRMGDMICTLPLLHALRREFPKARITVACEPAGEPIARSCSAVDDVFLLKGGFNRWQATVSNARQLQGYDAVIAVKIGFDLRLAALARMTQAPMRIGFERITKHASLYFTHAVLPPSTPEHQIESCLRLLQPLGIEKPSINLSITLPEQSLAFAHQELQNHQLYRHSFLAIINVSSTQSIKWPKKNFALLAQKLTAERGALVALVCAPEDRHQASELARETGSSSVFVPATPTVLELGALMEYATFIFTPEGGVGHLAAALNRPALIFWSGGPFTKWNTRASGHRNIRADLSNKPIAVDEIWQILTEEYLPRTDQPKPSYDSVD